MDYLKKKQTNGVKKIILTACILDPLFDYQTDESWRANIVNSNKLSYFIENEKIFLFRIDSVDGVKEFVCKKESWLVLKKWMDEQKGSGAILGITFLDFLNETKQVFIEMQEILNEIKIVKNNQL